MITFSCVSCAIWFFSSCALVWCSPDAIFFDPPVSLASSSSFMISDLNWHKSSCTWIHANKSVRNKLKLICSSTLTRITLEEISTLWAQSTQPKFPEISVQNSMDLFGPTGKVWKKLVHLLRWSSFPGRTGLNFGWMDRALYYCWHSSRIPNYSS